MVLAHSAVVVLFLFCGSVLCSKGTTDWESIYLGVPNEARAYEHLAVYTSAPHVAGTKEDYEMAQFTLEQFQSFGLTNSRIEATKVLLSYPKKRSLKMIQPSSFVASLQEDTIPEDPTSSDPRIVPTFNGYSPSGNVTAELVYLNYGSIEDFEALKNLGVTVAGKIGIARYGNLFRGTKAMIAQMNGMIGLIIYSDPADDGYVQGKTFPDGPWRPKSGVQRGSVQFLSICPGDPQRKVCSLDPNYNYTDGIPKIPVQPISWGDAQPLLAALQGPVAPKNFQGGLNMTYMIGPGPAVVNLELDIEFVNSDIWNVIAEVEGADTDRTVIIGNHRDAWVFGATDPNSGTAVLLEVARGLGTLLQQGWKPSRNILLASWDGEEYGLLGSTAWAEANAQMLQTNAVAYLNVDVAVTGPWFGASATHSLDQLLRDAASVIIDPNSGKPLSEVWTDPIGDLGSGSDYTAILDHFGVASMDMGFDGPYGVYHSTYDDIYWMSHFGDPTYAYHKACAQLWGLMTLRLADSPVVPFNYTQYGVKMNDYFTAISNKLSQANHTMDLSQLESAIQFFQKAAQVVGDEVQRAVKDDASLNTRLILAERQFLGSGLPMRPYYRHVIQAPGLYAGYAPETFPCMDQSIDQQNWAQVNQCYVELYTKIQNAAAFLSGKM